MPTTYTNHVLSTQVVKKTLDNLGFYLQQKEKKTMSSSSVTPMIPKRIITAIMCQKEEK